MKSNKRSLGKVVLTLAIASCTFTGAYANEDAILNSDPIDINGYVHEAPVTDHELETVKNELRKQKQSIQVNKEKSKKYNELSRTTEKLADVTEDMIEERKESQETINKFNKKIECMMQENNTDPECDEYVKRKRDEVKVTQAAPAAPVVEAKVEEKSTKLGEVIKILPYAGLTTINSKNENLEANVAAGLRAESDITSRLSIGFGFNYTSLKTTDFANAYAGNYNTSYWNNYNTVYAGGREVEYTNMSFDIYSKFFLIKGERFRPYLGGGISYNRTKMNFTDNTQQRMPYQNGMNTLYYQYGNEEVTSSHMKVQLQGGSEVIFTKNIGMNLELQYSRGLGSGQSSKSAINGPDQQRLNDFNDELTEANIFSVYAGMLVMF